MFAFSVAAVLGLAFGFPARRFGERFRLAAGKRIPATGGLALCLAWWTTVLFTGGLTPRTRDGITLALIPIVAVGLFDLRKRLGSAPQFLAQIMAAGSAVLAGNVAARHVTNPLGGLLSLNQPTVGDIAIPAMVVSIAWIVLLMNAVNFLDGLDGLAASVSGIGFLTIAVVSLLPHVNEPAVAQPALLAAGAVAGFLFWNFPPARLWLGTPGSWFLGFLLAVLSLLGSSKIATLAVVGAIPLLDAASVVLARIRRGTSPFQGDTTHLHHRLAAHGWNPRQILGLYALASAILALAAIVLPTPLKILLLVISGTAISLSGFLKKTRSS